MRDWKRGELQALSAAAKFLIFLGLFMVAFNVYNRVTIRQDWPWPVLGGILAVAGLVLGIWDMRLQKATGFSGKPPFGK